MVRGASAVLTIAFGVLVGLVRPRRVANVFFAVFCVCFGGLLVRNLFVGLPPWIERIQAMMWIVAGLAILEAARRLHFPSVRPSRLQLWLPALVMVTYLGAYNWELVRVAYLPADEHSVSALSILGDLVLYAGLYGALFLLAVRLWSAGSGQDQRRIALLLGGLVLYPAYHAGEALYDPEYYFRLGDVKVTEALLSVVLAAFLLAVSWRSPEPRMPRNVALLALAVTLVGMVEYGILRSDGYGIGVARIAAIGVYSYAILRHQLLEIDLRIKWTLRRGTLVGAFVAVFFVTAKLTESWAEKTFGQNWIVGAVATGLLLFAISPLQRLADRLANRAMPRVADTPTYRHFRALELYKTAVAELSVGGITPKERRALEALRQKLAVVPEDASAIERDILAAMEAVAGRRAGRARSA